MPVIGALGAAGSYALYGAIASAAVSLAGTGISAYSQQQQAENSERMAAYNAAVLRNNADLQTRMAQQQAAVNQQVAMAQYDAQQKNAAALANQAEGVEAQGREQARRMREEQERVLSLQRARTAKSGLVNEGSPLVVLADTARLTELNIQDTAYETNLKRTDLLYKAEQERYQSGFSLLDAGMEGYRSQMADVSRRIAYRQADLAALAGQSEAAQSRAGVTASLISGIGSAVGQGFSAAGAVAGQYSSYPGGAYNPLASVRKPLPIR